MSYSSLYGLGAFMAPMQAQTRVPGVVEAGTMRMPDDFSAGSVERRYYTLKL
ncbi:MAG: hypothetical protein ACYDDO_07110 [Acidiferrobacterales bacterium]